MAGNGPPSQPSPADGGRRKTPGTRDLYPPDFFRREDEYDDRHFYSQPRLVVHIDEPAIAAIGQYFATSLPQDAVLLDLMSSWRSHLPTGFPKRKLVGLGLNDVEMRENPQLDEHVVHDLNANPRLPLDDATFDAAFVTVSIQYMTRPVEVFREVRRILKPGATFHVVFSHRMFPMKAIAIWQTLNMQQRAQLIGTYFQHSAGWTALEAVDASPKTPDAVDPVVVVRAKRGG